MDLGIQPTTLFNTMEDEKYKFTCMSQKEAMDIVRYKHDNGHVSHAKFNIQAQA